MIVSPAYGRDYKTAKEAREAWEQGFDFILEDITSRWYGKYCSGRDFPYQSVEIRYAKKTKLTFGVYYPSEEHTDTEDDPKIPGTTVGDVLKHKNGEK